MSFTPTGINPKSGGVGRAPNFGTLVPNRIFVGGICSDMSEVELKQFFSSYGAVRDCKIITGHDGITKSYGFVTFESHEDVERIIRKQSDGLIFKNQRLNVGPAVRKQQQQQQQQQQYSYRQETSSVSLSSGVGTTVGCQPGVGSPVGCQPGAGSPVIHQPGAPYAYIAASLPPGALFCQTDPSSYILHAQGGASYPMLFSSPAYLQPTTYYHPTNVSGGAQQQWVASSPPLPTQQWRLPMQQPHIATPSSMLSQVPGGVSGPPQYVYSLQMMFQPPRQHEICYVPPNLSSEPANQISGPSHQASGLVSQAFGPSHQTSGSVNQAFSQTGHGPVSQSFGSFHQANGLANQSFDPSHLASGSSYLAMQTCQSVDLTPSRRQADFVGGVPSDRGQYRPATAAYLHTASGLHPH